MVTLSEARWWIMAGIAWAILSSPILIYPPVRETIYLAIGATIKYLFILLPIAWTAWLFIVIDPVGLQGSRALVPALFFSVILGGVAGYILRIIFKVITGR